MDAQRRIAGLYLALAGTMFASLMTTQVKFLTSHGRIPTFEIVFSRSIILVIVSGTMCYVQQINLLRSEHKFLFALRGIFGFGAISCLYASIQYMPLADAAALGFLTPIFITILSPIILREKISTNVYISLPSAFLGVILIAQPSALFGEKSDSIPMKGLLFGLLQSIFAALARLLVRYLGKSGESIHLIVLSMALVSTLFSSLFMFCIPSQHIVVPHMLAEYLGLIGVGFCATGVQFSQTAALQRAPASFIAPVMYAVGIWNVVLDFIVFGVVPGWLQLCGSLFVIAGSLLLVHEEKKGRKSEDMTPITSPIEQQPLLSNNINIDARNAEAMELRSNNYGASGSTITV